jgi:phospholipase/carboxylesterase
MLTRRSLLTVAAAGLAGSGVVARQSSRGGDSLLRVRPRTPSASIAPGPHPLRLGDERDGLLIVPRAYSADRPAPLLLLLHGAGGRAERLASRFAIADRFGVILLVPDSRGGTWDAIRGPFGPDVAFVGRALDHAFERCAVDTRKLAIGGFSDGATYALSLGLDNGSLFTDLIAFSPGFSAHRRPQGRPRIFISHGRSDDVLPIDRTSRRLVPRLEDAGYAVTYKEFDGPHTVPEPIATEAFKWFLR